MDAHLSADLQLGSTGLGHVFLHAEMLAAREISCLRPAGGDVINSLVGCASECGCIDSTLPDEGTELRQRYDVATLHRRCSLLPAAAGR